MGIRILIVDDHKILREGISFLLGNELGMEVVGEAEDGQAAVELARELQPDVIVMDIEMPNLNGIEATQKIVHELPEIKIIALAQRLDRHSVFETLRAGVSGYVLKRGSLQELITAIQNVVHNHTYLSPQISETVIKEYTHGIAEHGTSAYSLLTGRERQILKLLAEGKSTKEIAGQLHISPKTVDWHRSRLMNKLNVESIAELVKYAISEELPQTSV